MPVFSVPPEPDLSPCTEESAACVEREPSLMAGAFLGQAKGVMDFCWSECICRFQLSGALSAPAHRKEQRLAAQHRPASKHCRLRMCQEQG